MTDISDALVEAMARGILNSRYDLENGRLNANISWDTIDENTRARYLNQARAALAAIEATGQFVVVPKEPTDEMTRAGKEQMPVEYDLRTMDTSGIRDGLGNLVVPGGQRLCAVGFARTDQQQPPDAVYRAMLSARPKV